MGLFDLFRRKPEPTAETPERPSLIVALDQWGAPDPQGATRRLDPLTAHKVEVGLESDATVLTGRVRFGGHDVRVAGFDVPVPKSVMEKTVECSAWKGEVREQLDTHQAHLILFHEEGGDDAASRITALYQVAAALAGDRLAGVINESAWTCASADVAREFLDFDEAKALKEALPPVVYFGVLPFTEGDDSWVATKGAHLFGVPDLVIERSGEGNAELFSLLHNIIVYMVQGTRIAAGHTMQTGGEQFFRFKELSPDHKFFAWLKGAGETLKLVRISKEETGAGSTSDR